MNPNLGLKKNRRSQAKVLKTGSTSLTASERDSTQALVLSRLLGSKLACLVGLEGNLLLRGGIETRVIFGVDRSKSEEGKA